MNSFAWAKQSIFKVSNLLCLLLRLLVASSEEGDKRGPWDLSGLWPLRGTACSEVLPRVC